MWIRSTEIESVILELPKNESPGPDGFIGKFLQTFRKYYPSESVSEICIGRDTSKLILQGYHHLDTNAKQKYHTQTKRKITGQYHWWT